MGKRDIIQFSHANGFPASTYHTLFNLLSKTYDIHSIERLAHDPQYPVTDNWQSITHELIRELDTKTVKPVIGIGHSLGGAITLFAAIERPDLFKMIILLDTPVFAYHRAKLVQLFKKLGRAEWITPGGRAKRRRTTWSSIEEALEYFRSRPLFRNFTEECLLDYVRYGMVQTKDGLALKFNPEIESKIYLTLPHNYAIHRGKLKIPGTAIVGQDSNVINQSDLKSLKKNFNIESIRIPGGHLFPFERPQMTVELIQQSIEKFSL